MEIERKFLVKELPEYLDRCTREEFVQGYISTNPVIRIRQEGESFFLTVKGNGLLSRREFNLEISRESFEELMKKTEGIVIRKTRYYIAAEELESPAGSKVRRVEKSEVGGGRVCELDVFHGCHEGLYLAEVEFDDEEQAADFSMPSVFYRDVTGDGRFQNSSLSKNDRPELPWE